MDDEEKKEIAEELGIDPEEAVDMDEDKLKLMSEHDIDEDVAERVADLVNVGLNEDEAVEIAEAL